MTDLSRPLAAPAPTQQPKHVHEAWWLVEATFAPVPLYFAGPRKNGKGPAMVAEVNGAVRFPDKDSAERTMCLVLDIPVGMGAVLAHRGYAAREHIFDYTPRAALSGAAPIPQPELTDERIADLYDASPITPTGWLNFARAIEREVRSLLAASPAQEAQQPSSEKPALQVGADRFFMDHGMWHDRVTGQHLFTQDQYDAGRRDAVTEHCEREEEQRVLSARRAALSSPASTEGALPKENNHG